ncbi:hypothetical protein [Aestuariibius sp. HNIBRBA575]|uniref:hypothetical protein n=1 Tax=Aestuariibius sp. HNIBRBA575 TaxID=3233343 RepID=UPI0034A15242
MRLKTALAVCATIISTSFAASSASATILDIIDFDFAPSGILTAPYVEDGYQITATGAWLSGAGHDGGFPVEGDDGSGFLMTDFFSGYSTITLSRVDGEMFDLVSLFSDVADFGGFFPLVTISNHDMSIPAPILFPLGPSQSFLGGEFTNLLSVSIDFSGVGFFALDSIHVASSVLPPVPVPAGLPLMAGALGLFAFARRRKAA